MAAASIVFVLAVATERSSATPAFARKYRTSCGTCHVSFPKLNAFGEAYRLNGYQVPGGDEPFTKEEPVSLGAEAWKRVWPEGIWPSSIPGTAPLAVRATGGLTADLRGLGESSSGNEDGTYGFLFPSSFNLYAAGNLAEDVSLWFAAHLFQGDSWGALGKLHVTFTSVGDAWVPPHLFNLRIGQFVPGGFAFDHHRNLTFSTPLAATANVIDGVPFGIGHVHGSGSAHAGAADHASMGDHGHAGAAGPTYSGAFALGDGQVGAELYGLPFPRLEYTLGAVNGAGTAAETDNDKDMYARLRFKIGGMAFDGTSADADDGSGEGASGDGELRLRDQGAWVDNSVIIGAMGYFGKRSMSSSTVNQVPLFDSLGNMVVLDDGDAAKLSETETAVYESDLLRAGGDLQINLGDFELLTMVVWGRDSNPYGEGVEATSLIAMSQLDWVTPWPFLISSFRYETARFTSEHESVPENAQQVVLGLTALVRANVRIQLEGQVDLNREHGEAKDYAAFILDASF